MTSIVIADDHAFFRAGVEAALVSEGFDVVASVDDGDAALRAIADRNPDVVILDIRMPVRGGVSTIEAMRAAGDNRPVVVLAAELSDDDLLSIMKCGVNGVVFKQGAELRLFDALKAVSEGSRFIEGDLLEKAFSLAVGRPKDSPLDLLTARERQIVEEVALGLRNREIAERLGMSEGTVKVYLHNIFSKLGVDNRTELALMVRGGRNH